MPRLRSALLRTLVLLAFSQPVAAQLVVVDQTRTVDVAIEVRDDVYSSCVPLLDPSCTPDSTTVDSLHDGDAAPDSGPFSATASVAAFPSTLAQQDSSLGPRSIDAGGSHGAISTFSSSGGFPLTLHSESHDTETRLLVSFRVDAATRYALSGSVTTSGGLFSSSSARIALDGPGGPLGEVAVTSDPDCTDPETCGTVGPEAIALAGVLAVGVYTLEAVAGGTAGGVHDGSGSYGSTESGRFDVHLELSSPVPATGWGPSAALALALVASARFVPRLARSGGESGA